MELDPTTPPRKVTVPMFHRRSHANEGAGLGAPPTTYDPNDAALVNAPSMHLDPVAARFPEGETFSVAEAKAIIQRFTRTRSGAHHDIDAVFAGLLGSGGLV